jgi:hypothetical protein
MGISVETRTFLRLGLCLYIQTQTPPTGGKYAIKQYTAGDSPNWTEEYDHCKSGDLLRLVYMWVRVSIFDKFSLKENGRILSLKHLERIKAR